MPWSGAREACRLEVQGWPRTEAVVAAQHGRVREARPSRKPRSFPGEAVLSPSHPNGRPQANALPWCILSALPGPEALKLQSAPGALPEYIRTASDWQRRFMPGRAGSRADAVQPRCPGAETGRRPWNGRPPGEHRGAVDVLQTSRPDTAGVLPPDGGRMPYATAGDGRRGGSRRRGERGRESSGELTDGRGDKPHVPARLRSAGARFLSLTWAAAPEVPPRSCCSSRGSWGRLQICSFAAALPPLSLSLSLSLYNKI